MHIGIKDVLLFLVSGFLITNVVKNLASNHDDSRACKRSFDTTLHWRDILTHDGAVKDCVSGSLLWKPFVDVPLDNVKPIDTSETEDDSKRGNSFQRIFSGHQWANRPDDTSYSGLSRSGSGSTLNFAQETIGVLHTLITVLKLRLRKSRIRFLDLACGDMQWMSRFLETRSDVDYTGYDIVPALIINHRNRFAEKTWKFEHLDIVKDEIHVNNFDIIMARHVFMHLKNADVSRVLHKLSQSEGYRILLATTFSNQFPNKDVDISVSGRHRRLNLEIPPISLSPPMCLSSDGFGDNAWKENRHYIGVWELPVKTIRTCEKPLLINTLIGSLYSCVSPKNTSSSQ